MPGSDANLAFTPATELLTLISNREVSSTELTELYLGRIEEFDPQLNAYVTVTPEFALEQAAKADEATAARQDSRTAARITDIPERPSDD